MLQSVAFFKYCRCSAALSASSHRWHIAIPWFIGGALMLVLPFAWMRGADEVSYTLLVLASMGIMGCDGECLETPLL